MSKNGLNWKLHKPSCVLDVRNSIVQSLIRWTNKNQKGPYWTQVINRKVIHLFYLFKFRFSELGWIVVSFAIIPHLLIHLIYILIAGFVARTVLTRRMCPCAYSVCPYILQLFAFCMWESCLLIVFNITFVLFPSIQV